MTETYKTADTPCKAHGEVRCTSWLCVEFSQGGAPLDEAKSHSGPRQTTHRLELYLPPSEE